jgi:hypothetical protein
MHTRAVSLGQGSSERVIESNEKIVEVFSSYRESVVRNRRDYYARQIGALRYSISDIAAEIYFLPYISIHPTYLSLRQCGSQSIP